MAQRAVTLLLCACTAAALSAAPTRRVYVRLSPLIGGPKALKVHSAVFIDSGVGDAVYGFDFVPLEPTAPRTLSRLVTLRGTPGEIRTLAAPDPRGMVVVGAAAAEADADAIARCAAGRPDRLHLVTNNCWAHSIAVAAEALGADALSAAAALAAAVATGRPCDAPPPPIQPPSVDPLSAALADEKTRRFGTSLAALLPDDERRQSERAAAEFQDALRALEEEAPGGDS